MSSASCGFRILNFRQEPENGRFLFASSLMNSVRVDTFVSGKTIFCDRPARMRWGTIRCSSHSSHQRNWGAIEDRLARSVHVLDLYVEFRNLRNGLEGRRGLLDAALAFRLPDAMSAAEKDSKRQRILQGAPWTSEEREAILNYCASDVRLTVDLFNAMRSWISLPHALLRGKFMGEGDD